MPRGVGVRFPSPALFKNLFFLLFFCIHQFLSMMAPGNSSKTPVSHFGEFGLIKHLTRTISLKHRSTLKGVGDDAAVLDLTGEKTLLTTDFLIEGIHFDLSYMPLRHLGYKAVAANVSDICAMNAVPTHITVSLAVSNRFSVEDVEELYTGILLACERYGVDVVGGDTGSSPKGLFLSITALGRAKEEHIVYRSGAKPNDLLVVTGDLGGAYMGLQVLQREKEVFMVNPNSQPDLMPYSYIVERQLKPEARTDIVALFAELSVQPTAMIDVSDGLSSEILHLCEASAVGCRLYEEKIPLDPQVIQTCEEFHLHAATAALNGGEDYELLFTLAQEEYPKIKANPHFTIIGHITEAKAGAYLIARQNTQIPLQAQGWNGFSAI